MQLPLEVIARIEQMAGNYSLPQLRKTAEQLSARYRDRSGASERFIWKKEQAVAYAATRMSATFCAVYRALLLSLDCYGGEVKSVLDVGAGTGAAVFAANDLLAPDVRYIYIEREQSMIEVGSALMQGFSPLSEGEWKKGDARTALQGSKADMVIAAYMLNELPDNDAHELIDALFCAARGMVILIEPGTKQGFSRLLKARQQIICRGGHVAAPCPSDGACRLAQDDWCHFTARVERSRLHKSLKSADAPYEDEKFCFLAAARQKFYRAPARILRHPNKASGHIGLQLCTAEGPTGRVISKKQKENFRAARKAQAGDAFFQKGEIAKAEDQTRGKAE